MLLYPNIISFIKHTSYIAPGSIRNVFYIPLGSRENPAFLFLLCRKFNAINAFFFLLKSALGKNSAKHSLHLSGLHFPQVHFTMTFVHLHEPRCPKVHCDSHMLKYLYNQCIDKMGC